MNSPHASPRAAQETRVVAGLAPEVAFGRACAHLMTRPAFAKAPFGHIARSLAGQVNRGHYAFAISSGRVVGFAGWALTCEAIAEAWVTGVRPFGDAEAVAGDCVVLNYWQADDPEISRLLIDHMRNALPDARRIYAKRHYPDGRIRPVRLRATRRN
jgi:hemolysin-activating ACP:hemolysin acyltransferase